MEITESRRILVVESDPAIRGSMVDALLGRGYRVDAEADGEAAWRALLGGAYDLLVTADVMPKASGLALVRRIRVARIPLPVVVASDRLDEADVERISRDPWARFDGFMRRPVDTSALAVTVQSLLLAGRQSPALAAPRGDPPPQAGAHNA
jgi:CheY-like chemotaxis protein